MGELPKASAAASGFRAVIHRGRIRLKDDHGSFSRHAHARAHRQESIGLVMSKWKIERDVAEKALDLMMKTWSDNGQASDQALQAGIEESLKVSSSKQTVALSRVADLNFVREVYRELREK
jgi:hypothetical protein